MWVWKHLRNCQASGDARDSVISSVQQRGATAEAESLFREALTRTAPALNDIAWIYARVGKAERGLRLAQAAVEIDATNAHYMDTFAEVEFNMGDQASALKTIENAAKLDPSPGQIHAIQLVRICGSKVQ